ncbi:MAG: zinc-ribbon domain-containing protein [Candidatus Helarchaeota archaeon]
MEQDDVKLGLGIPYLILIFLTWMNALSSSGGLYYYYWIYSNWGGLLVLFGCLLLIPVFILTIIFISSADSSLSESVAFGLAVPAWLLILIGAIVGLYYTISSYLIPILFFVFICPQIILGCGLFARRGYGLSPISRPTPTLRRGLPYQRPAPPPRHIPPRAVTTYNRGERLRIPEEVRLASTMGQTLKSCIRCNNTLDSRTQICYFCGARQPTMQRLMPTTSPALPTTPSAPSPRYKREEILFCPNCGARTLRGALFCTQCGSSLE